MSVHGGTAMDIIAPAYPTAIDTQHPHGTAAVSSGAAAVGGSMSETQTGLLPTPVSVSPASAGTPQSAQQQRLSASSDPENTVALGRANGHEAALHLPTTQFHGITVAPRSRSPTSPLVSPNGPAMAPPPAAVAAIQPALAVSPGTSPSSSGRPDDDAKQLDDGPQFVGNYRIIKFIAQGSYGRVRLAQDMRTGQTVALKFLSKENLLKRQTRMVRVKREIRILKLLHHPNIVQLHDVAETEKEIILTMEYAGGGELFDYIVAHSRLKEKEARRIFRQVLSAVAYCHENCIIHRDLKPENILLDNDRNVKIIDFGLSNMFNPQGMLETYCGSPYYAAPEMIVGQSYVGPEVDVWSMGVILYTLLCGRLPFHDLVPRVLYERILAGNPDMPVYLSDESRDLMTRMMTVDRTARISLAAAMMHPWVLQGNDGPPPTLVPVRQRIREFDRQVLQQMPMYAYDVRDAEVYLHAETINPYMATYYLLMEKQERERQEAIVRRQQAEQQRRLFLQRQQDEHNLRSNWRSGQDPLASGSDGDMETEDASGTTGANAPGAGTPPANSFAAFQKRAIAARSQRRARTLAGMASLELQNVSAGMAGRNGPAGPTAAAAEMDAVAAQRAAVIAMQPAVATAAAAVAAANAIASLDVNSSSGSSASPNFSTLSTLSSAPSYTAASIMQTDGPPPGSQDRPAATLAWPVPVYAARTAGSGSGPAAAAAAAAAVAASAQAPQWPLMRDAPFAGGPGAAPAAAAAAAPLPSAGAPAYGTMSSAVADAMRQAASQRTRYHSVDPSRTDRARRVVAALGAQGGPGMAPPAAPSMAPPQFVGTSPLQPYDIAAANAYLAVPPRSAFVYMPPGVGGAPATSPYAMMPGGPSAPASAPGPMQVPMPMVSGGGGGGDPNEYHLALDGGDGGAVRTMRGIFSSDTSSSRPLAVVEAELTRVLETARIQYQRQNYVYHCTYRAPAASTVAGSDPVVVFDLEICQIQRLELYGIRMYRMDGDLWLYKQVCNHITTQMRL